MDSLSRLRVEADVNNLSEIRGYIQNSISSLGVPQGIVDDLILAVDEVVTNIIIHGYIDLPGMIEIEVKKQAEILFLRIVDQAPCFDPTQVPSPDLTLPLDKRPMGKYGLYLIRKLVNEVIYEIPPEGGNQLTLVKNILKYSKPKRSEL